MGCIHIKFVYNFFILNNKKAPGFTWGFLYLKLLLISAFQVWMRSRNAVWTFFSSTL